MTIKDGSGSGVGCLCKLSGGDSQEPYPVGNAANCAEQGGTCIPPPSGGGGGVCGGCGVAIAQLAASLGWFDVHSVKQSRTFFERAIKLPVAKTDLVEALNLINDHFVSTCKANTAVLGQMIPAFAWLVSFMALMSLPAGAKTDSVSLPDIAFARINGTLDEMRKGSEEHVLHEAIRKIKAEFAKGWRGKTVAEMRAAFGMATYK